MVSDLIGYFPAWREKRKKKEEEEEEERERTREKREGGTEK